MRRRDALPDPEVLRGLRELDAALAAEPTADPDLSQLVADIEAARPEPSATFLASLDARVHTGFPRETRTVKTTRTPWHARIRRPQILAPGFAALLLAGIVAVTLQSGNDSAVNDSASFTSSPPTVQPLPERQSAAGESASSADSAVQKSAPSPQDRKVQRAAELTLTPKPDDVQKTADGVVRETQAAGGYVQRSDIATRDGGGEATFTLRIPSARLDDTLARLSKLAHVGALSQSASDITSAVVSAADQLSDARAERAALLRALGKATTDRQIASLKARLADNRSEIALRKGALDAQRRRADLATVSVTVQGTGDAAKKDDGAWTPRDALHDAGRVLEIAGGVALIALAVLAPLAIVSAPALLAGRTLRRRRREGALDGAA
ncbi:MAG TPA: DUF4349 domain-containing protein [Baekduia sp.]|nr:DUF4349 domain-containing protein [Baekduia sp.]